MEAINIKNENILVVEDLVKHYPIESKKLFKKKEYIKAVDHVNLTAKRAQTLGIVGESGCGKSTLGKTILRLIEPTGGKVFFQGKNIYELNKEDFRNLRKDMQIIFQDPFSSLNPRMKIKELLTEPFIFHGIGDKREREERINTILHKVGLTEDALEKYPHEFSGGQRQRVGIARALILHPSFIICDEAVSALDVSIQSQILNLLMELQRDLGLTYMFISHDLSVIKHISNRVAVMYLGKVVEVADVLDIFKNPLHPYTQALLSAKPIADPTIKKERIILKGEIPNAINLPSGCRFHTRCRNKMDICEKTEPNPINLGSNHFVSCHCYSSGFDK